jgi:hypothetical protein
LLKMMTRSAKRKLQEEEGSQTESKCRKSDESDPEISAQLAKIDNLVKKESHEIKKKVKIRQHVFLPINEICERYHHLGEIIFGFLDDQSLKQSRKVCTTWSTFLDSKPFYWTRVVKNYIGGQEEFLDDWKRFFYKIPIEIAKPFALRISRMCRKRPDYFEVTRPPLHTAVGKKGHSPFFEYIYEKVMEKNPKDYMDKVPLHVAAYNNNLRICKFIHEKGHPMDPRSDKWQYSPT